MTVLQIAMLNRLEEILFREAQQVGFQIKINSVY
jgi:hypothetical protein